MRENVWCSTRCFYLLGTQSVAIRRTMNLNARAIGFVFAFDALGFWKEWKYGLLTAKRQHGIQCQSSTRRCAAAGDQQ